jgi:methyl-accepting chemotaxis protein
MSKYLHIRNWPIATKIAIAPVVLILSMIALGFLFNSSINRLSGAIERLFTVSFTKDQRLSDILYASADAHGTLYQTLNWASSGVKQDMLDAQVAGLRQKVLRLEASYQAFANDYPAADGQKALREATDKSIATYVSGSRDTIDFIATTAVAMTYAIQVNDEYVKLRRLLDEEHDISSRENSDFYKTTLSIKETIRNYYVVILCIFVVLGITISLFMSRQISQPIRTLTRVMNDLANGKLDIRILLKGRFDEIGSMVRAVDIFRHNAEEKQRLETEAEHAAIEAARARTAREDRERKAIEEISGLCIDVAGGIFTNRITEHGKEGFILDLTHKLNQLNDTLKDVVGELVAVVSAMEQGDMDQSINGSYAGAFGQLKDSVNAMAERLHGIATGVAQATRSVHDAAREISSGSIDLAQRTESQAANAEETAASMQALATTVRKNAERAQDASRLAQQARSMAENGGTIVDEAITAMADIEDSTQEISNIVVLMDEISFQTNLLALNASVEAARAGEYGKGFSVVAQEVRSLAQRSSNASKDIKKLIMESNGKVRFGVNLVNKAGTSLSEIVNGVGEVSRIVSEIADASSDQAEGLEQVNAAVSAIDEMTQRNGALVEQTSASASALESQADTLTDLVAFFKSVRA